MASQDDEFEIPRGLEEAMKRTFSHRVAIPASVDERVRWAARGRMGVGRRRMILRWGGFAAAAAACLAVAFWAWSPSASRVKGDLNGDGTVTMVDAMLLARHVANHDTLRPNWDINGDGVIDQKDADALANASVSLKGSHLARGTLPRLEQLGTSLKKASQLADAARNEPDKRLADAEVRR